MIGDRVTLCIRGQDVRVCGTTERSGPRHAVLDGVVADLSFGEHHLRVGIDGPVPLVATIPREHAPPGLAAGTAIVVQIDAAAVHVIPEELEARVP